MDWQAATTATEPQRATAPELPSTSNGIVNSESIGWATDITNPSAGGNTKRLAEVESEHSNSELRHRSTGTTYAFTGSALSGGSIDNINNLSSSNATAVINTKDGKDGNATATGSNAGADQENASTGAEGAANTEKSKEQGDDSLYECNICLDTAKDAVVSMCGHLFCWPCLHQWLQTRPNRKLCPVCKAAVDKDKVIPLYGRNSTRQEDPRNKVPPRPAGQRTEPEPSPGFPGFGFGDGFHMSFGIGAFPFGFFTSSLNFGEPRPPAANRGTTQHDDEQNLSQLFLYLAFLCMAWLLFA